MESIKKSRTTTFSRFLTALGIPYTGKTMCRKLSNYCKGNIELFIEMYYSFYDWTEIKDVGKTTAKSINEYLDENLPTMEMIIKELVFESEEEDEEVVSNKLSGITFVITGDLFRCRRASLVKLIQSLGGKHSKKVAIPSVGKIYLINNDITSETSKNVEAKNLGIDIISEDDFYNMINF